MVGGRIGPAAALEVGEDAIAAFLVQRLEMSAETGLVIHVSSLDHLNPNRPLPRPGSRGYRCSAANGKPPLIHASHINAGIGGGVQGLSSINRSAVTSARKPMVERHFRRILVLASLRLARLDLPQACIAEAALPNDKDFLLNHAATVA
jgi:hypothetical protein